MDSNLPPYVMSRRRKLMAVSVTGRFGHAVGLVIQIIGGTAKFSGGRIVSWIERWGARRAGSPSREN